MGHYSDCYDYDDMMKSKRQTENAIKHLPKAKAALRELFRETHELQWFETSPLFETIQQKITEIELLMRIYDLELEKRMESEDGAL